ncbi:MAG TPA: class I SAM-dependent methyltransferase [Nitrososphaerales archaeon]|nr:class I SAM-dependent methyltransferase [Nitrososphaerales archaeon]
MAFTLAIRTSLPPERAFSAFFDELRSEAEQRGMEMALGPSRHLREGGRIAGTFEVWRRGREARLKLAPGSGVPRSAIVEYKFRREGSGCTISIRFEGREGDIGDAPEQLGWFAREIALPSTSSLLASRAGEWITDRRARRPTGRQSRSVYADPIYHRPNFLLILEQLKLMKRDVLLDVGCGGGAFLKEALLSGCSAAGVDHSVDMVELAARTNRQAISAKRLVVKRGEAEALPFGDTSFTCATMTGVFGFIQRPVAAFEEVHRVLKKRGRFVLFTSSSELKGTPAAPEPMASRLRFYDDSELASTARKAGFRRVKVARPDMLRFLPQTRVPQEARPLFENRYGQLLVATK